VKALIGVSDVLLLHASLKQNCPPECKRYCVLGILSYLLIQWCSLTVLENNEKHGRNRHRKTFFSLLPTCIRYVLTCCQALPSAPSIPPHNEAEEVVMHDADISNLGKGTGHGRTGAYDEDDDEDMRGGQRVQCAHQ